MGRLLASRWLWAAALLVGSATGSMLLRDATEPTEQSRTAAIPIVKERQPLDEEHRSPEPHPAQGSSAPHATRTPVRAPTSARVSRGNKYDPWADGWWVKLER